MRDGPAILEPVIEAEESKQFKKIGGIPEKTKNIVGKFEKTGQIRKNGERFCKVWNGESMDESKEETEESENPRKDNL